MLVDARAMLFTHAFYAAFGLFDGIRVGLGWFCSGQRGWLFSCAFFAASSRLSSFLLYNAVG